MIHLNKVYILHKLPTPYNDVFFRNLHDSKIIELQVYHLWRGSWRRPWKAALGIGYPNTYMKLKLGIDWSFLNKAWAEKDSFFLIADWGHVVSLLSILIRYFRKAPVSIWVDTPQEQLKRPFVKRIIRKKLLKWLLPKISVIFATGAPARRILQEMGAKSEQIVNLPCFVDLDRPKQVNQDSMAKEKAEQLRNRVGCNDGGIVFAIIGTLVEKKGQDIGIKAFAQCRQQSNQPLGLLIVGDGPMRKVLETQVANLGIDSSVAFLGWQEPDEMDIVYLATDVVLHPARYDPFPLVILEAMSWSKVVIGSNVCGSVEDRVNSGTNGFAFPSEDVDMLVEIMMRIIKTPKVIAFIGSQARITAEEWPISRGVEIVIDQARRLLSHTKSVEAQKDTFLQSEL